MTDYDNTHRAFLQVFLARGCLTFAQAQPILASILSAADPSRETRAVDITTSDFNAYLQKMNSAISPFDYEIRSGLPQQQQPSSSTSTDQQQGERIYALVNTTSDPMTSFATLHSPEEIAFVKRLLDAMFETFNTRRAEVCAVTSMQGLDLARPRGGASTSGETQTQTQQGLTKAEAERTLEALVDEGWLDVSSRGYYRLSTRALIELRTWLVETYNDDEETRVRNCVGCGDIVVVGRRCVDLDCGVRVHGHCLPNVLRASGGEKCPTCGKVWEGEPVYVGEKAARRTGGSNVRRSEVMNGVDGEAA